MHRDNVIYLQISDTFSCSTKTGTVARHKEINKKKTHALRVGGSVDSFFLKRFLPYLNTQRNNMYCLYIQFSFAFFTICLLINQSKTMSMTSLFCALKESAFWLLFKPICTGHTTHSYQFERVSVSKCDKNTGI